MKSFTPWIITEAQPPHRIDRKVLASLVFNNPEKLQRLNLIVWPQIAALIEKEIEEMQAIGDPHSELSVVVVDAALLFDAGWDAFCDEVRLCLTLA